MMDCCWSCIKCPSNNIVLSNECRSCSKYQKADIKTNKCLPLPQLQLMDYMAGPSLGVTAALGMLFTLVYFGIMIWNNDKHMVRASGRDLSYFMLLGTLVLFMSTGLFLLSPGLEVCVMREMVPSMALMISFTSFGLKNIRLYRIFEVYKAKMTSPTMISPRSQVILVIILIIVQLFFSYMISHDVYTMKSLSSNGRAVLMHCNQSNSALRFLTNNVISILSMIGCSYLSYKLRDLPKSYNETRHYSVAAYSIVIILGKSIQLCWVLFRKLNFVFIQLISMSIVILTNSKWSLRGDFCSSCLSLETCHNSNNRSETRLNLKLTK